MDEGLHRLVDALPRRGGHLAVAGLVVTTGHGVGHLLDDAQRLVHLTDPDAVAVVDIPPTAGHDVELVRFDTRIGLGLAQIPRHSGRSKGRTCDTVGQALVRGDDSDSTGTARPDGVFLQEILVVSNSPRYPLQDLGDVLLPPVGQIGSDSARTDVVVVHPQPGGLLEEGQDQLPFPEAVHHHRQRTDVHTVGGGGDQV